MLNGKELVENGIIFGNIEEENIAQHGVDLNLIKIERIVGAGIIPYKGKTQLPKYEQIKPRLVPFESLEDEVLSWHLQPGTYSVTFQQGCRIPNNQMLLIRQRSSLLRCGTFLHSSVFDAGFETQNIGTVIVVTLPITIQYNARIAQIYNHECTAVENLYNGQFQNDKQRK